MQSSLIHTHELKESKERPQEVFTKHYYYFEERPGGKDEYDVEPGEYVDFDRLANADPKCWVSTNHSVARKKLQQYIFQNPSCFSPDNNLGSKIHIILDYFSNNPGIKIHVPLTDGRLVTVKSPMGFINAINNMKMLSEKEMEEIIAKNNLSRKQIRIIHYSLSKQRPDLLFQSDYKNSLVEQKKIPFRQAQINLADFVYIDSKTYSHIVKNLPSEIILDVGREAEISPHQIECMRGILNTNQVTRLNIKEKIDENGDPVLLSSLLKYHPAQLGNLRSLTIEENNPELSRVSQILSLCTNLVFLELKSVQCISQSFHVPVKEGSLNFTRNIKKLKLTNTSVPSFFYNLPELETVVLNRSSVIDWKKLGVTSPKLKSVKLAEHLHSNVVACLQLPQLQSLKCVSIIKPRHDEGMSLRDEIYPLLTELDISGDLSYYYERSVIPEILLRTPNLKKLTIRNLCYDFVENKKIHLSELQHLNISSEVAKKTSLRNVVTTIINNTKNLISLSIDDKTKASYESSAPWINENLDKFSKLTSISIKSFSQPHPILDIGLIISAANQLMQAHYFDYSCLENVSSSDVEISMTQEMRMQFFPLSFRGPDLLSRQKTLSLKCNAQYKSEFKFDNGMAALTTLEELKIEDFTLDSHNFVAFLSRNSRLKRIELSGCKFQEDEKILDKIMLVLPQLRELHISKVKLSSNMLLKIIFSAPRLKKMSIKKGCMINHPVTLPLSGVHTLKEVEINWSGFHSTAISAILNQGSHINHLVIASLSLIDNEIPIFRALPKLAKFQLDHIYHMKLFGALLILGKPVQYLDLRVSSMPADELALLEYRFPELSELFLSGEVSNILNEILASTRSLKNLYLLSTYSEHMGITIVEKTQHAWAGLQVLGIAQYALPRYVLQYCPNLTILSIEELAGEYHKGITLTLPHLNSLAFSCIGNVNSLKDILNSAPNIKMMDLGIIGLETLSQSENLLLKYVETHREIRFLKAPVMSVDVAMAIRRLVPHADLSIYQKKVIPHLELNNVPHAEIQRAAVAGKDSKPSEPVFSSAYHQRNAVELQRDVKQSNTTYKLQQYVLPNKAGYPTAAHQIIDTFDIIILQDSVIELRKTVVKKSDMVPVNPEYQEDLSSYHLSRCKNDAAYESTHFYLQIKVPLNEYIELPGATVTDDIQCYETVPRVFTSFTKHPHPHSGRLKVECDALHDAGDEKAISPPAEVLFKYTVKCKDTNYLHPSLSNKKLDPVFINKVLSEIQFMEEQNKIVLRPSTFLEAQSEVDILQALIGTMQNKKIWKPNNNIIFTSVGAALCNDLLKHKTGRCVQQAILGKIVADHLNVPCMIDSSRAHVALRLFIPSILPYPFSISMGGYPAGVETLPMQLDAPRPKDKKIKPSLVPAQAKPLSLEIKNSVPSKIHFDDFYFNLRVLLENVPSLKRSALLHCRNPLFLLSLAGELLTKIRENDLDSFYIDDLEKLGARAISSQFGIVESGLKQFLERQKKQIAQTNKPATGWLVIHVSNNALGLFNLYSALDSTRILGDAGEIPPGVTIICLMQENSFSQDASFTSRFALNPLEMVDEQVELAGDFVLKKISPLREKSPSRAINLYGGDQGKSDSLDFLLKVLKEYLNGTSDAKADDKVWLNLKNVSRGHLDHFYKSNRPLYVSLLQLLSHAKEFIDGRERYFPLDANISLTQNKENFANACTYEALTEENAAKDIFILNPALYTHFLNCFYSEEESGHIKFTPGGILANHQNKDLAIRLTRSLAHSGQWSRFFDCARQYNVRLRIIMDPSVYIPTVTVSSISNFTPATRVLEEKGTQALPSFSVILSNNPAASADIIAEQLNALSVYVSRTHTFADLFESFKPILGKPDEITRYEHLTGDLIQCLREKKPIVLFGHFSLKLTQRIESLVAGYLRINGKDEFLPGQLVIITQPHHPYPAALTRFTHSPEIIIKESKSDQPVQSVSSSPPVIIEDVPSDKKTDIPADECAERLGYLSRKIREDKGSCIFIEGPTAAGKSVAVRNYLKPYYETHYKDQPIAIFEGGIPGLIRCLEYHRAHLKTLCLWLQDEANLEAKGKFDFLHGYAQKYKPGIMLALRFYPKSDILKVVFTGNPRSYAGRQVHAFFNRYPEMFIYFAAYSRAYVEHYVIRPLLTKLLPDLHQHHTTIMQIFHEASSRTPDHNTSIIRAWPQMCFRVRMFLSTSVFPTVEAAAKMAAYDEVEGTLTPSEQAALQSALFESQAHYQEQNKKLDDAAAQEIKEELAKLPITRPEKFFLEPSHYHSMRLLNDQMKLRKIRGQYPEYAAQGIRGILLEGETEAGKTSMLHAVMDIHQIVNAAHAPPTTKTTSLCHFVTSTNAANDDIVLRQGGILICNEWNFMPEGRFYNVLTGTSKESEPSKDQHQFAFFATQNGSASYNNRIVQSPATKSRICQIMVPAYGEQEHVHILRSRGFPNEVIQKAIDKKNKMGGTWRSVYREVENHELLQEAKKLGQTMSLNTQSLFTPRAVKSAVTRHPNTSFAYSKN